MPVTVEDDRPLCQWGQCTHSPNAHGRDHCHACDCEKPPPPPPTPAPGAGHEDSFDEPFDVLDMELCTACSAYVQDREKHVTKHEEQLNTMSNLMAAIRGVDHRVDTLVERLERLQSQIGALDRAVSPKPEKDF
jgi:hypothetical protein